VVDIVGTGGDLSRLATLVFKQGDLLIIIACALYASFTVGLRQRPAVSALGFFTALAGVAFVVSLPFSIGEYMLGRSYWPSAQGWVITALVTIFPSFLAQILFIQSVEKIGPNRSGVFINLVPVYSSLLAVVILGEPFGWYHGVALGMVLGGIWLSQLGK